MVGAWGFEPQTPTVSINVFSGVKNNLAAREVTNTLYKTYEREANRGKIVTRHS